MKLIVNIENENLADKIIKLLMTFKDEGVSVIPNTPKFSEDNWKEIIMNTHSADIDDDEYLYEAAWEFYNEKHCD